MNFNLWSPRLGSLPGRIRGMFNLNDPRWGRGDDASGENAGNGERPEGGRRPGPHLVTVIRTKGRRILTNSGAISTANSEVCLAAPKTSGAEVIWAEVMAAAVSSPT